MKELILQSISRQQYKWCELNIAVYITINQ